MNYSWKITNVEYNPVTNWWNIELDNIFTYFVKRKPCYKTNDTIISLTHFYQYIETLR